MIKSYAPAGIRSDFAKYLRQLIKGGSRVLIGRTNDGRLYIFSGYIALCVPESAYFHIVSGTDKVFSQQLDPGAGYEIAKKKVHPIRTIEIVSRFERAWNIDGCLPTHYTPYVKLGDRILKNGMDGDDVKELQTCLIGLDYDCGVWGADGEFGDATEQAVEQFQHAHGCMVDGEVGPETLAALEKAMEAAEAPVADARYVQIVNGNCYVRTAPNTDGKKLGVAHRGDILDYQGVQSADGWHLVVYNGQNGWVSGKYSELAEAIVLEHGVLED